MRYIKWTIRGVVLGVLFLFLHYALPQRDIVQVSGVEQISNFQTNWPVFYSQADQGTAVQDTFSLRLIQTVRKRTWLFGLVDRGEQTMVYRNQDTGWIWPPYFKFDSSDLQAEAARMAQGTPPGWAIMTHYGWRIIFITVYPNAISLTPIDDPDIVLIPWFNIIFLTLLVALWWGISVRWRRFRRGRIDPTVERIDDAFDERRAGMSRWLGSWRKKPRV